MVHFLVIGATGLSGITFIQTALQAGHDITIYARNPSKLPADIREHHDTNSSPHITIFTGEFTDRPATHQALTATSATVLVSFAGPAIPAQGTPLTTFYHSVLFPLICQGGTGIERMFILCTPSFRVPEDRRRWKWWLGVWAVKLLFGDAWDEVNGIGRVVTGLGEGLVVEWTLFRVPILTNGEAKAVRAGYIGSPGDGMLLSRKSNAIWILQELEERKWVGKCPALSNVGWL